MGKIAVGEDVDEDLLARGTTGFTGAEIENMINQAALKAAAEGYLRVTMAHIEEAKDRVMMGGFFWFDFVETLSLHLNLNISVVGLFRTSAITWSTAG